MSMMNSWACRTEGHGNCQAVRAATLTFRRRDFSGVKRALSETERCMCECHSAVVEKVVAERAPRPIRRHGTLAAYTRHYRLGEKPCDECRRAASEHGKLARAARGDTRRTSCRRGHPYEGENLITRPDGRRECRTCKLARYVPKVRQPRKLGPFPHGTLAGKSRHARAGERPCDECREAYNAWQRANRPTTVAGRAAWSS